MSTDGFWSRLLRGTRRVLARPDWELLCGADWADRVMTMPVTDRFHAKQGRSTGRLILQHGGRRLAVYLKRHYRLSWWSGLLALFRPGRGWSPGMQEYHHLQWARSLGVPVPAAVAVGEVLGPWGRLQSFLAVEELHDMLPLNEAIPLARRRLDPHTFERWKRTLLEEMARLVRLLHGRKVCHKDLYLCHFYVARADTGLLPCWRDRVYLIDLHRLGRHRLAWRLYQSKDLAQLLYSSEIPGVTARDRLRFWRAYLGEERKRWRGRWLRRLVLLRWRNYRGHNRRRAGLLPPPSPRHAQAS
jgi:heptose I phosphotransferase